MPTIKDIIIKPKTEKNIFNTYLDVSEMGRKIFESFKTLYVPEKGYPLAEKDERFGVISNVMALSTLLEIEDMGVSLDGFDKEFEFLLKDVFSSVYGERSYKGSKMYFRADPYVSVTDDDKNIDSYVETASKIAIVMIDLRNYANKHDVKGTIFGEPLYIVDRTIKSFSDLAKLAEDTFIGTIEFLIKAALRVNEKEIKRRMIDGRVVDRKGLPADIKYRGWTFCNPNGDDDSFDTSIYYTYHVTNVYVSLYNAYPGIINKTISKNLGEEIKSEDQNLEKEEKEIYKKNEDFVQKNWELIDEFRRITASSGRYVENRLNEKGTDLATDFVRSDFSGISSSNVISTQDNNAVMNTLFILAIYLNAGIDEDYEWAGENKIDWFFNSLQFSISNIRKIYSILKGEKRQELVDSYSIYSALLSEKYPASYRDFIQRFRKECKNVAVYDLIPLLCNTYSIVFDYLIKYPQLEMVSNLELIMENCSDGDRWLWGDANGFSVNNNLYYIVALENFYRYYEEYELPLSGYVDQYNQIVKEKTDEYEKKISEENEKYKALVKDKERLEDELKNKKSDLDMEVVRLAEMAFENMIENKFNSYMSDLLMKAMDYYLQVDFDKKQFTEAKIRKDLAKDTTLRNAFALFGAIKFDGNLIKDLNDYDRNSMEYNIHKQDCINTAICENIVIND